MSFGWAFLLYLFIGFILRLIFIVVINYKSAKDKAFEDNCKDVMGGIEDLVENHSQGYKNPQNFRFLLMIFGYVFWPLDLLGFVHFLFPPKE